MAQIPVDEDKKNVEEPKFNRKTTVDEVLTNIDLRGKLYLITGTNSGIGKVSAKALALNGATVICCVRDEQKMKEVIEKEFITQNNKDKLKKEQFLIHIVDLLDLENVSKVSKEIAKKYQKIDGIMANAGVMFPPERRETKNGFEYHLGVNYFAHFLMIHILTDNLIRAKPSRVVVVSAIAHRWCKGIDFDDINLTNNYDKFVAYGQSCAARCMYAIEYNRRYAEKGVIAFSLHPGIIETALQREFLPEDFKKLHVRDENGNYLEDFVNHLRVTPEQGAATQVWALTSPFLNDKGGAYLMDCQIASEWDGKLQSYAGYSKWLYDKNDDKKLWEETTKLLEKYF